MPEREPCRTAPLPSQQSFQSDLVDAGGKPPLSPNPTVLAEPPESGFARNRSTDQQVCWRAGRQRQAFATLGTDPQSLAATRTAALEGALPVARYLRPCRNRKSKLPRCKAQAAQAWQPRGLPCSEAPCQAAKCSGRVSGATMASHHHSSHRPPETDNPKVALLGSTLPVAGRSSWVKVAKANLRFQRHQPSVRGDHKGRRARKHPAGGLTRRSRAKTREANLPDRLPGLAGLDGHEDLRTRKRPARWQSEPAARR
jgi:hypothetical protein